MTGDNVPVTLRDKLKLIVGHWRPRIVARLDGYHVKLAKVQGEFVPHTHSEQDELFLVLDGELTIRMPDGDVLLKTGDLFVIPSGVEHCPVAESEASILIIERADTDQTGGVTSDRRAGEQEWI